MPSGASLTCGVVDMAAGVVWPYAALAEDQQNGHGQIVMSASGPLRTVSISA